MTKNYEFKKDSHVWVLNWPKNYHENYTIFVLCHNYKLTVLKITTQCNATILFIDARLHVSCFLNNRL